MNKKIKVIKLLNKKANNEKMPSKIRFAGLEYKYKGSSYYDNYGDLLCNNIDLLCVLDDKVEILEDEEEIDIENIQELRNKELVYDVTLECEHEIEKTVSNTDITETVNQLIRAVKQLDKKINKED